MKYIKPIVVITTFAILHTHVLAQTIGNIPDTSKMDPLGIEKSLRILSKNRFDSTNTPEILGNNSELRFQYEEYKKLNIKSTKWFFSGSVPVNNGFNFAKMMQLIIDESIRQNKTVSVEVKTGTGGALISYCTIYERANKKKPMIANRLTNECIIKIPIGFYYIWSLRIIGNSYALMSDDARPFLINENCVIDILEQNDIFKK